MKEPASVKSKLTLRLMDPDDYTVHENGQLIGRIRHSNKTPGVWHWTVIVTIPGPPFGDAKTIEEAKERFEAAWQGFKAKCGPDELAKAFDAMNYANRTDRYRP